MMFLFHLRMSVMFVDQNTMGMLQRFQQNTFLMLRNNQEYRKNRKEFLFQVSKQLMQQYHFNYTEILDMDISSFMEFQKDYEKYQKNRLEVIESVQKNNPQSFIFNLPL